MIIAQTPPFVKKPMALLPRSAKVFMIKSAKDLAISQNMLYNMADRGESSAGIRICS